MVKAKEKRERNVTSKSRGVTNSKGKRSPLYIFTRINMTITSVENRA